MTKQEILIKFSEKKGEAKEKNDSLTCEKLGRICSLIDFIDDESIEEDVPAIHTYLETSSALNNGLLDGIIEELEKKIKRESPKIERHVIETMNMKTKKIMWIFLAVISLFAVAAVGLTVLNLALPKTFTEGWGAKLAGAFGTFDFALGALGFVLERRDDMKKREIHSAVKEVNLSSDTQEFISIIYKNCRNIASGYRSKVVDKSKTENCLDKKNDDTEEENRNIASGDRSKVIDKSKNYKP